MAETPSSMTDHRDNAPDLVASLREAITAARLRREQRERDNLPCPKCGGDRLRSDFTGSDRCHAPRADR